MVSGSYNRLRLHSLFFIENAFNLIKFTLKFLFNFGESRCFFHVLLLNFLLTFLYLHGFIALLNWVWSAVEDWVSLNERGLVARLEWSSLGRVDVGSLLMNYLLLLLLAFSYRVHLINLLLLFFWRYGVKVVCARGAFLKSV